MSSISNTPGVMAVAASAADVTSPEVVTEKDVYYCSDLNYTDFFSRVGTILGCTIGGAGIGSGLGVPGGPPGMIAGGIIGGGIGFSIGYYAGDAWDDCRFRKWELQKLAHALSSGGAAALAATPRSIDRRVADLFGVKAEEVLCPLTKTLIFDPVTLRRGDGSFIKYHRKDGVLYIPVFEKETIAKWIRDQGTCPVTGECISMKNVFPDLNLLVIMYKTVMGVVNGLLPCTGFTSEDVRRLALYAEDCFRKIDFFDKRERAHLMTEHKAKRIKKEEYDEKLIELTNVLS